MWINWAVIAFIGLVTGAVEGNQKPKPYKPGAPVTYPPNYCKNIQNNEEFDFVVVGSGPAGSTIAARLAEEASFKVLLVEAGDDPPKDSDIPGLMDVVGVKAVGKQRWNWESRPDLNGTQLFKGKTFKYGYGKVLGGSSIFNSLMYTRGNPRDYDEWAAIVGQNWSYQNVLPYFRKLESYHGPTDDDSFGLTRVLSLILGKVAENEYVDYLRELFLSAMSTYGQTSLAPAAFFKAVSESGIRRNPSVNQGGGTPSQLENISTGQPRSSSRNFNEWAQKGANGWNYEPVFPYFLKLEDNHGLVYERRADSTYQGSHGPLSVSRFPIDPRTSQFRTAPKTGRGLWRNPGVNQRGGILSRLKNIFTGQRRGSSRNYNEWAEKGASGWDLQSIVPYFFKLEDPSTLDYLNNFDSFSTRKADSIYHGSHGPLTVSPFPIDPQTSEFRAAFFKAATGRGLWLNPDVNGRHQTGFSTIPGMIDQLGYRSDIVRAYLQDIPSNLKVCKNALVTSFDLSSSGGRKSVKSVSFLFEGRRINVIAKKEYILSAGFASSQILERSGIGNATWLQKAGVRVKHELPGVGENLQDHFLYNDIYSVDYRTAASPNPFSISLTSLTGFLNLADHWNPVPDVQFFLAPPSETHEGPVADELAEIFSSIVKNNKSVLLVGPTVLRQEIPGFVHITQASDPNITPDIQPNYLAGERDVRTTIAAVQLTRRIMHHPALKPFAPERQTLPACRNLTSDSEMEILCSVRQYSVPLYHSTGTSSMGPDPRKHVVDSVLKVHGIHNLRVADSTVMPLIVRSNTEIPTVMIAERAADLIKKRWGHLPI